MTIQCQPLKPIAFGYQNPLKTLYKEGKLPTVEKGFYGGNLSKDNATLEHVKCASKGGSTSLDNLVLATSENNQRRGNKPLSEFYNRDAARVYYEQFIDVKVPYQDRKGKLKYFDGNTYVAQSINTVNKELLNEHRVDLMI